MKLVNSVDGGKTKVVFSIESLFSFLESHNVLPLLLTALLLIKNVLCLDDRCHLRKKFVIKLKEYGLRR